MKLIPLLIVLSLSFASCSQNAVELISSKKEVAQHKFDQLYKCYSIAKSTPKQTVDKINWESDDAVVKYQKSNVYQIGMESFKDLSLPLDISYDGTRRREHADMAKLFGIDLSGHKESHDYKIDKKYRYQQASAESKSAAAAINHFLDSKYLILNRVLDFVEPSNLGGGKFSGGYVSGDVLVFDIEKAKLLGGFALKVESNKHMSLRKSSNVNANLKASLDSKIYGIIKEKFDDLTPAFDARSYEL